MGGIRLLALDGADTIGGSKLLLNYDSTNVMLDFGTNFHSFGTYYEEYLKPRSTGGLLDYVVMGVLPDARSLYREDLMHPELTLKGPDLGHIDALLLSHAHADHFGDMGFMRLDVPLVTNAMSAIIVKAVTDTGKADLGKDHVSPSPRKPGTLRGTPIIESCTVKETRELGLKGRNLFITESRIPERFSHFWAFSPSIEMSDKPNSCKPHIPGTVRSGFHSIKFRSYPVDHSVKGACAYVITTTQGNVVYTGDFRMHGVSGHMTEDFMGAARSPRPYILITEGTRLGRVSDFSPDFEPTTEKQVLENATQLMSEMDGDFVIADFGPRNIERLEIFLDVARKHHRKMVVTAKDAYLLHSMHIVDPSVPIPGSDILIFDCPKGSESKFEEYMLQKVYPGSTIKGGDIGRSPGDYLVSFSFFDLKHLVDIKPEKGHYMYSSCEAFSEEQEIDFIRMGEWLKKFNIKLYGFSFDQNGKPVFSKGPESLHASGHATRDDLARMVREIDPEVVVPVHTEHAEWFVDNFGGERKVVVPDSERWIEL